MRIRKLELHGFKSFPDRTVLHFDPGISCIVGPNGCGKSNVMDALRWCIGEQSARSLRGSEMLDVIFAGSQDRKPVGFAEVVMTLTSDGGEPFPGEFAQMAEVSVGRRLHRTGASEYLINQRRVRRRDVVDLFLDTGIGNNLYSFIEQGRIGKIIHARPEERRSLIDEAAGIARYKIRRDEARDRLAATSTQLDRAADVADEMARRVRSLSRQVKKAARFRRLRALIRQDEIALAMAKYGALSQDRRALRNKVRQLEGELGAATRGRARREADLTQRRAELAVVEQAVETWRDEVAELDAQTRELTSTVGFSTKRLQEIDQQQATDSASLQVAKTEIEAATSERIQLVADKTDADARIGTSQQVLHDAKLANDIAQRDLADKRALLAEAQDRLAAAALDRQRLATEGAEMARQAQSMPERARVLAEGVALASQTASAANARIDVCTSNVALATAAAQLASEAWQSADEAVRSDRRGVATADATLGKLTAVRDAQAAGEREQTGAVEAEVSTADNALETARSGLNASVTAALAKADAEAHVRRTQHQHGARQAEVAAQRRAAQWISAHETDASSAEKRLRARLDDEDRQYRTRAQTALDTLQDVADQRLTDALTVEQDAVAQRRSDLSDQLEQAVDGLAAAERQLEEARAHERETGAQHSASLARLQGLRAALAADRAATAGLEVLTQTLGETPRLADVLDMPARGDAQLLIRLGARLQLPVVSTLDDLARVSAALPEGASVQVLFRPSGPLTAAQAMGPIQAVSTLQEAMETFQARSVGSVTAAGEAVLGDGVVSLGSPDGAGARAVEAVQAIEQAEGELLRASVAVERSGEATEAASVARDEIDAQVGELRDAVDELRQDLQRREDQIRERERLAIDSDRKRLVQQSEREAVTRAEARESRLHERRMAAQTRLEQARVGRERALTLINTLAEAASDGLERELASERDRVAIHARTQAESRAAELTDAREKAREKLAIWKSGASARAQAREAPVVEARGQLQRARAALESAQTQLSLAAEHRSEGALELTRCDSQLAVETATLKGAEVEVRSLKAQLSELEGEEARLAQRLGDSATQLTAAQALEASLQSGVADLQVQLAGAETKAAASLAALSELNVAAATWVERARSLQAGLAAIDQRVESGTLRINELTASLSTVQARRAETGETLRAAEAELTELSGRRAESWDRLERERERVRELREGVRTGEEDLRALADRVGELTLIVEQSTVTLETTRAEIDGLRRRIEERYQQSVPGLLDRLDVQGSLVLEVDPSVSQSVEIEGELIEGVPPAVLTSSDLVNEDIITERVEAIATNRQALDRIGDVNLAAFDEWAEVRERHTELETQRADLETSVARIRSAIAKMNRTCRQRFRDTFDLVNGHFKEMYPKLVGGGSARLALTNEEDLLETGVDIFVQPPGKRLQNLTLLSGGEKAMTAIALILSLFKVKPSPFCVLDEVDAPLDEANGSRFNEALKEMASASQFIVVTHNRKTMECASTLYGVTMADPGCSRLVSVRLGE